MSEQNPRDTHFAGFAKALMHELFVETKPRNFRDLIVQAEPILARRAYDLVHHTLLKVRLCDLFDESLSPEANVLEIPDLTELPEPEQEH